MPAETKENSVANFRLGFSIPHDLKALYKSKLFAHEEVYDPSGVSRGFITSKGILLNGESVALMPFDAAKANEGFNEKVPRFSGWKYWSVKRKGELISLYQVRRNAQVNLDVFLKDMLTF